MCDCPSFATLDQAILFCKYQIKSECDYVTYGYSDYWASPDETLKNMQGDCEDIATLFAYIAHSQFNHEPEIILEKINKDLHAYVRIENRNYFFISGKSEDIYKTYSYDEAIWISTHTHAIIPL